jgi:hypothetical protein
MADEVPKDGQEQAANQEAQKAKMKGQGQVVEDFKKPNRRGQRDGVDGWKKIRHITFLAGKSSTGDSGCVNWNFPDDFVSQCCRESRCHYIGRPGVFHTISLYRAKV